MNSTNTERLTVYIDSKIDMELRVIAAKQRKSISEIVNTAVVVYLSKIQLGEAS